MSWGHGGRKAQFINAHSFSIDCVARRIQAELDDVARPIWIGPHVKLINPSNPIGNNGQINFSRFMIAHLE
jgi:hypothetical protein